MAAEDGKKRALTAAALAHNRNEFAALHVDGNALQNLFAVIAFININRSDHFLIP